MPRFFFLFCFVFRAAFLCVVSPRCRREAPSPPPPPQKNGILSRYLRKRKRERKREGAPGHGVARDWVEERRRGREGDRREKVEIIWALHQGPSVPPTPPCSSCPSPRPSGPREEVEEEEAPPPAPNQPNPPPPRASQPCNLFITLIC